MTKNQINEREQLEMLTIDHLVRKLDATIDFTFIYPLVEDLYSTIGRPSIDSIVLIKMTFIQYTFGKNYIRRFVDTDLCEQIFYRVLKEVADQGLLSTEHIFIDSTPFVYSLQVIR